MVPNCPGAKFSYLEAKLSAFIILVPNWPVAKLSCCQIVRLLNCPTTTNIFILSLNVIVSFVWSLYIEIIDLSFVWDFSMNISNVFPYILLKTNELNRQFAFVKMYKCFVQGGRRLLLLIRKTFWRRTLTSFEEAPCTYIGRLIINIREVLILALSITSATPHSISC